MTFTGKTKHRFCMWHRNKKNGVGTSWNCTVKFKVKAEKVDENGEDVFNMSHCTMNQVFFFCEESGRS